MWNNSIRAGLSLAPGEVHGGHLVSGGQSVGETRAHWPHAGHWGVSTETTVWNGLRLGVWEWVFVATYIVDYKSIVRWSQAALLRVDPNRSESLRMKLIICTGFPGWLSVKIWKSFTHVQNTFCVFWIQEYYQKPEYVFRAFSTTPCNSRPRSLQLTQKKRPILCMCEQIWSCHRQPAWNLGSCNPWNEAGNLGPGTNFWEWD